MVKFDCYVEISTLLKKRVPSYVSQEACRSVFLHVLSNKHTREKEEAL